jgi:hypothetical protein
MLRLLLASSLCAVLAGCATRHEWVKPEMTSSTKEADLAACSSKTSHLATDDSMVITIMDRCMAERGYQKKVAE